MEKTRFGNASSSEIKEKRENIHAKSTQKENEKCARALREYLVSREMATNFEELTLAQLDEVLSYFYIDARKVGGEKYKASSLEGMRFSLNLYLQGIRNHGFDITKDAAFRNSNVSFRAAMQELKREGKGDIKHHPEISENHLKIIYNSELLKPNTPSRLQNKIQFDIRFYFLVVEIGLNIGSIGKDRNCQSKLNIFMKKMKK